MPGVPDCNGLRSPANVPSKAACPPTTVSKDTPTDPATRRGSPVSPFGTLENLPPHDPLVDVTKSVGSLASPISSVLTLLAKVPSIWRDAGRSLTLRGTTLASSRLRSPDSPSTKRSSSSRIPNWQPMQPDIVCAPKSAVNQDGRGENSNLRASRSFRRSRGHGIRSVSTDVGTSRGTGVTGLPANRQIRRGRRRQLRSVYEDAELGVLKIQGLACAGKAGTLKPIPGSQVVRGIGMIPADVVGGRDGTFGRGAQQRPVIY